MVLKDAEGSLVNTDLKVAEVVVDHQDHVDVQGKKVLPEHKDLLDLEVK